MHGSTSFGDKSGWGGGSNNGCNHGHGDHGSLNNSGGSSYSDNGWRLHNSRTGHHLIWAGMSNGYSGRGMYPSIEVGEGCRPGQNRGLSAKDQGA